MSHLIRFPSAWPNLTFRGVVDILVVAFLIYQCLMVVRGTRAGHIVGGILVMLTFYVVALRAGLEALQSLLSLIVPYIGIAIIVLFQSESRRTLARIGRKRWLGLVSGFKAPMATSEVLMALEQFSERRTGAL